MANDQHLAQQKSSGSLLAAALAVYWQQSRRPLASLVFVMPLLILYEGGVLLLGPTALRNGADVWLRQLLDIFGLTSYFLLPLLTVGVLLGWHHITRDHWQLSGRVLYGMLAESALLGFLLLAVGYLQWSLLARLAAAVSPAAAFAPPDVPTMVHASMWSKLVGFAGAGIYEEVLFRLLLLPLVYGAIGLLLSCPKIRVGGAIVLSSLAFSAAHYLAPHGDTFVWFSFVFRSLAGGFFALLFVFRGFGIAAGCHALYDIFVGIW